LRKAREFCIGIFHTAGKKKFPFSGLPFLVTGVFSLFNKKSAELYNIACYRATSHNTFGLLMKVMIRKTYQISLISLLMVTRVYAQSFESEWIRTLNGPGTEVVKAVATDNGGSVYATGYFTGTVDFDPGPGTYNLTAAGMQDIFITKCSSSGELIWARRMGGPGNDAANDIAIDPVGNVLTCGFFHYTVDFNPGSGVAYLSTATLNSQDIFISKLNASGNFQWAKAVGGTGYYLLPGVLTDAVSSAQALSTDETGNVILGGQFLGSIDFNPQAGIMLQYALSVSHVFVLKLNSNGIFTWVRTAGENTYGEELSDIEVGPGNTIFSCGNYQGIVDFDPTVQVNNLSSVYARSGFLWTLSATGDCLSACSFGGNSTADQLVPTAMRVQSNGGLVLTGYYQGSASFTDGSDVVDIQSNGSNDLFVCRFLVGLDLQWVRSIGGTENDRALALDIDENDRSYVVGSFRDLADFDPGFNTCWISSMNSSTQDMFLLQLDAHGNFIQASAMGGIQDEQLNSIRVYASGSETFMYCGGIYQGVAQLDPAGLFAPFTATGGFDACILKIKSSEENPDPELAVPPVAQRQGYIYRATLCWYPNPGAGCVMSNEVCSECIQQVLLVNIQGSVLKKWLYPVRQPVLFSECPAGQYFLISRMVYNGEEKMVIEPYVKE